MFFYMRIVRGMLYPPMIYTPYLFQLPMNGLRGIVLLHHPMLCLMNLHANLGYYAIEHKH